MCASPRAVTISQPDPISVALSQLVGAILFSLGSACFVWSAWADEWVTPWRIGCALWIGGCVPYFWPPLRNERLGEGTHISNALQVIGMLAWAVGSGFAFHHDVDFGMQVTNAGYLIGSACLLLDPLLQARQLFSATTAGDEKVSLVGDLLAGLFYTLAGAFGGYASDVALIQFGNVCWLVGSLISGTRPCVALYARRGGATSAGAPAKSVELEEVTCTAATATSASAV